MSAEADLSDELVEAVESELLRRRRRRWKRRSQVVAQIILGLAAIAAIASGLHDIGLL